MEVPPDAWAGVRKNKKRNNAIVIPIRDDKEVRIRVMFICPSKLANLFSMYHIAQIIEARWKLVRIWVDYDVLLYYGCIRGVYLVVPNFLAQEQVDACLGDGLLKENWQVKDGYINLPTKPGLDFEIDEKEAEQNRGIYEEELGGEFYFDTDGSVADW